MTSGQRNVAVMLAVVAVMLGLNLIVRGSPTAVAAPPVPEPTVVAGAVTPTSQVSTATWVYRFWSDGTVDISRVGHNVCTFSNVCGPPIVVIP